MTRIMLDRELRAKLHNLTEELELCDESGRTLGHFLPTETFHRLLYNWASSQFSDAELQRRLDEPGGRTLAKVMADLETA